MPARHVKETCSHESSASADMMQSFVTVKEPRNKPTKMILLSSASLSESMNQCLETTSAESETINPIITEQIFTGYLSDLPTSDESDSDEELDSEIPN